MKRIIASLSVLAMLFNVVPLNVAKADNPHLAAIAIDSFTDDSGVHLAPFDFSCPNVPLFNPVFVAGSGSLTNPAGQITQYHYSVNWGDGTSDVASVFTGNDPYNFAFNFGPHVYTATGNFLITAQVYHSQQGGKDSTDAQTIPIATCVHVPPPSNGSITVTKVVSGGTAQVSDFALSVGATPVTSGVVADVAAGAYAITETGPAGYTPSFTGDCDSSGNITIVAPNHYDCTMTNTFTGQTNGTITVNKAMNNPGVEDVGNFNMLVNGVPVARGLALSYPAGNYVIGEEWAQDHFDQFMNSTATDVSDWYTSTTSCIRTSDGAELTDDFNLDAGDDVVCTITNDDKEATLTIVKEVAPGAPVGTEPDDFTYVLHVDGQTDPAPVAFDNVQTQVQLPVGTSFEVRETVNSDYVQVEAGDCENFVDGDGALLCTITNTYDPEAATIIINKVLPNDDGGTESINDFNFFIDGVEVDEAQPVTVTPGSHTITEEWALAHVGETLTDRYTVSFSGNCTSGDVSVVDDEVFVCAITNDDIFVAPTDADLEITKTVDNANVDDGTNVTFTLTVTNHGPADATNVVVTDNLVDFTFVSATASVGAYDAGTDLWTIGSLANGASATLDVTATAVGVDGEVLPNTATVSSDHDNNATNNSDTVDVTLNIPNTNPTAQIRLLDPCISMGDQGRLIAQFGYDSSNASQVTIPAGSFNQLGGDSTRIPLTVPVTDFLPGLNPNAFTVDFDAALEVSWTVDWDMITNGGNTPDEVTASADSPLCTPPARATLTVRKIVVNNGGDAVPSDFTLQVDGTDVSLNGVDTFSSVQFRGSEDGTVITLAEGNFTVTEVTTLGYDVKSSGTCSGAITANRPLDCEITNTEIGGDRLDGTLTFEVIVNGGDATPDGFNIFLNGDNVTAQHDGDTVNMPFGGYTLFQEPRTGYEAAFSGDCSLTTADHASGDIASSEDATCTITNTYVGGPAGGGTSGGSGNPGNGGSNGGGSTPPGVVLGDSDEQDPGSSDDTTDPGEVLLPTPPPVVLGETDELPRTGLPVAGVVALGSMLTFISRRKRE